MTTCERREAGTRRGPFRLRGRRLRAAVAAATAVASLILAAGAAGGPTSESATVLVSTTGDHSEIVRSVRITKPAERARRVVMSMGRSQLPSLQAGDRLLSLDGRWTDSVSDCYRAARYVKPGMAVRVVVERQGKEKEVTVKPSSGL